MRVRCYVTGDEFLSLTCWRGYNRRMVLVGILLALEKRIIKNVKLSTNIWDK